MKWITVILMALLIATIVTTAMTFYSQGKGISEEVSYVDSAAEEKDSPADRISEDNIKVYNDRIVVYVEDPEWATFTDTNSMDPVLDKGANAIQIIPKSEDEINVGDIISYKSSITDGIVIHRVINIGEDEQGRYFIVKGDNNKSPDPEKIRFKQITRVVVAIVY